MMTLIFAFFCNEVLGIDYYKPIPAPICDPYSLIVHEETKGIPSDRLPQHIRAQGKSESCGLHAALDAFEIFQNSKRTGDEPLIEFDDWDTLKAFEDSNPPRKNRTKYMGNPSEVLLFLQSYSSEIKLFSGRTVEDNLLDPLSSSSMRTPLQIQLAPFLIKTYDLFSNIEEMESVIKDHFAFENDRIPDQSLIFSTCYASDQTTNCETSHALNLYQVTEVTCQNLSSGIETKVLKGFFRNSWKNQQVLELDLRLLLTGMVKYGLSMTSLEARETSTASTHITNLPFVIHRQGGIFLHYAFANYPDGIQQLLKLDHPLLGINQVRSNGETALYVAASKGHDEVVRELLKNPTLDLNKGNILGTTPLMAASFFGHSEVVRLLLKSSDLNVNVRRLDGATAHLLAAQKGHVGIIQLLNDTLDRRDQSSAFRHFKFMLKSGMGF